MNQIVVRNLSDQLVEHVRDLILSGAVSADVPIKQDLMASQLGVSKVPLREALAKLEQEGLVRSQAHRGYFVRALSGQEAEEVYQLRLKLEPDIVAMAAKKAGESDREKVELAYKELERVTKQRNDNVGAYNRIFHLALIRPADKPLTAGFLERLHVLSERYVRKHLESTEHEDRAVEEHRAIFESWMARDRMAIMAHIREHISLTLKHLRVELAK